MTEQNRPQQDSYNAAGSKLIDQRVCQEQHIEVYQHPLYGNQLVIDKDLQISAADFAYNSALIAPLLTLPSTANVAILGGGDGGALGELLTCFDRLNRYLDSVTLVEIEPAVIELSQQYLQGFNSNGFNDNRCRVVIGDALAWIRQANQLDAVIYDLTMDPVRADISQAEFMAEIISHIAGALTPKGMLSMQVCGEWTPHREQFLADLRKAMQPHFEQIQWQEVIVPSFEEKWTFCAALKTIK